MCGEREASGELEGKCEADEMVSVRFIVSVWIVKLWRR